MCRSYVAGSDSTETHIIKVSFLHCEHESKHVCKPVKMKYINVKLQLNYKLNLECTSFTMLM